jgi:hypothetical protein
MHEIFLALRQRKLPYLRQMLGKAQCDFEVEILWETSRKRTHRPLNEAIVPQWSYIVGGQIVNDAERRACSSFQNEAPIFLN